MKGIIRRWIWYATLSPTLCLSKQLMPVYDKPMIYYPLSVLMLAGFAKFSLFQLQQIFPISKTSRDGSQWGLKFSYATAAAKWLGPGFILGRNFIGEDSVCLT